MIYALHGFLGSSQDWRGVLPHPNQTPSYFTDSFFEKLQISAFIEDIQKISGRKIFVGYSLGGRIGLQILEAQPEIFDHYVFVSTHPGLQDEQEKVQRRLSDQQWIDKLKTLPWDQFIHLWNQQAIFTDSSFRSLESSLFKQERLITALSQYSLGNQKDYRDVIYKNQNKITWVVGEKDPKFLNLVVELEQKKILLNVKRIFSGHRVLIDKPTDLRQLVESLL